MCDHRRYDSLDAVQAVIDAFEDGSGAHANLPQNEEGDDDDDEVHGLFTYTHLPFRIYIHTHIHTYTYIESRLSLVDSHLLTRGFSLYILESSSFPARMIVPINTLCI